MLSIIGQDQYREDIKNMVIKIEGKMYTTDFYIGSLHLHPLAQPHQPTLEFLQTHN